MTPAPRPPPPRRKRPSLDASGTAPTSAALEQGSEAEGKGVGKAEIDAEQGERTGGEAVGENRDLLADLSALQAEIDALRAKAGKG